VKAAWIALLSGILVTSIAGVFQLMGRGNAAGGVPSPASVSPTAPTTSQQDGEPGVVALIKNTWDGTKFIGVARYPSPASNAGRDDGPGEGASIRVICQVGNGRLVTETEHYRDRPMSSTVWDRLSDGTYISDLYTSLGAATGGQLSPHVPKC
jgi:hypothetical protein